MNNVLGSALRHMIHSHTGVMLPRKVSNHSLYRLLKHMHPDAAERAVKHASDIIACELLTRLERTPSRDR